METPKSQRNYNALRQRLQDLINRDAEEAQRRQQEDAFAKQLGGGQNGGKGLTGKGGDGQTKGKDNDNKNASPANVDTQVQKLKDQTSLKDAQLSALAGQLKKAGIQPDFKSAKERRGRSRTPKGGGKGSRSQTPRESSGSRDVKCYNCGEKGHYASDCPKPKWISGTVQERSASRPSDSESNASSTERRKQIPCFNHRPWEGKECLKGADCGFLHVNGKEDLPPGWEFRKPKAKARRRGNRVRPRSGQLFTGTVGKMLLAATALAGCQSGVQQASSLCSHP